MKSKNGISLIVLVITIIIMIILATAIIISLNNTNIIEQANEAVEKTDFNTIKTAVDLKYADYILGNLEVPEDSTIGKTIENELVNDKILTEETKKYYSISDNGTLTKLDYWDNTSYMEYAKGKGYEPLKHLSSYINSSYYIELEVNTYEEATEFSNSIRYKDIALPYGLININVNSNFLEICYMDDDRDWSMGKVEPHRMLLPNTLTSIGNLPSTATTTSLTEIVIPDSVTSIDANAFINCPNLTKIYYSGSLLGAPWGANSANVQVISD